MAEYQYVSTLDMTLFIRNRRGITITDNGEDFITYARQVYAQYEILTDKFINQKNIKKKFGVSCQHYSFAVQAFSETIRQFEQSEFDFAIREVKTYDVIHDVSTMKSEIGILFLNEFNEKFIKKILIEHELIFHKLMDCTAHAFVCRDHPLANHSFVTFENLQHYPCIIFEQGDTEPYFFAEELLPLNSYNGIIKTSDKLTMLTLIAQMNGFTLCTGMIYEKLNDKEYIAIPFQQNETHTEPAITIGYIIKKNRITSEICRLYLENIKKCLQ